MAFNSFAWSGQSMPMAPKPALSPVHDHRTGPETAWTVKPASTGTGYEDPQPVDPRMAAPGLFRDLSWAAGHKGSPATRAVQAPVFGALQGQKHTRDVYQARSALAHGDTSTTRLQTHQLNFQPVEGFGYAQGVDKASGLPGPTAPAQTVIHSKPDGQFVTGASGEVGPSGFRIGVVRRWASRHYSSPALGAMYSRNSLRGILPQIVATPHNQPALAGVRESGIPSNRRFLGIPFTVPSLYTTPRSASDVIMAGQAPQPPLQPMIGTGVM